MAIKNSILKKHSSSIGMKWKKGECAYESAMEYIVFQFEAEASPECPAISGTGKNVN